MTWHEYLTRASVLDTEHPLEAAVLGKLQGRLLSFTVEEEEEDGSLILYGLAPSYHVKQLAQCEVMNLTDQQITANYIRVDPHLARR